ncbi:MAG TPA: chemotaxis protein CheA [Chloroflexota bacterium]|nr:chemotaxis protein CheA [Chloroflexota bacterium]
MSAPAGITEEEWELFLEETREQIEALDAAILQLEQTEGDRDLLRETFRLAHTIKGSSAAVGLDAMTRLTHAMESLLDRLRGGQLSITLPLADALFTSCDLLRQMLARANDPAFDAPGVDAAIRQLTEICSGPPQEAAASPEAPAAEVAERRAAPDASAGPRPTLDAGAPETFQPPQPTIETAHADEHDGANRAGGSIRIGVDQLDVLMNLVGELVIDRARIEEIVERWRASAAAGPLGGQIEDVCLHLHRTLDDLRDEVLKSRMVPVSSVLRRLPRVVRDVAQAEGKEVELRISGEETELDRAVVEELADPLVHLVRNSVDHGIETPDERRRQGKSPAGIISIAARHDGNQILIDVSDDGAGVDTARVREIAIARGLIAPDSADALPARELLDLIFVPGFSTASSITEVSGRGVGMDIVRSRIERVNGSIALESEPGRGAHFTIRLPLTLAIIRGLLVTACDRAYAIPLTAVAEVVRVARHEIQSVGRRPATELHGEMLPLVWLDELIDGPRQDRNADAVTAVAVHTAGRRIGIVVERLLGEQDVVIKQVGTFLGQTRGMAGATILVDGRVCPILNIAGLLAGSALTYDAPGSADVPAAPGTRTA